MAPENDDKKPATENAERQASSAGSVRKPNQRKTRKSTTRAVRRKATNSFQPASDGLLLHRIAYGADGQPIPGIRHLYNSLIERFDSNDVLNALAAEMAVVDYARMARGLQAETRYERLSDYTPSFLSTITRYVNSSRRNLDNSLKMLRELEAERAEAKPLEELIVESEEWPMSEDDLRYPLRSKEEVLDEDDSLMEDWPSASDSGSVAPSANTSTPATDEETLVGADASAVCTNGNATGDLTSAATPTAATDEATKDAMGRVLSLPADGGVSGAGESAQPESPKVA
jgi:hypothetical protein